MDTLKCFINGQELEVKKKITILEAAKNAGIEIPTLCFLKNINQSAVCRMCVVEIKGMPRLMPACSTLIAEGMEIETESELVVESRKRTLDLMCKRHRMDCEYCTYYTYCELHALVRRYGLDDRKYSSVHIDKELDLTSAHIIRDDSKCIRCRRCVTTCDYQGISAIGALGRNSQTKMGAPVPMPKTECIGCGQCVKNCPTGALSVRNDTDAIWRALNNKKHIVFGITPYVAKNIGRFFGEESQKDNSGKIAAIARKIGIEAIFDVRECIPQVVEQTANVLSEKVQAGSKRTIIASTCPAIKKHFEGKTETLEVKSVKSVFSENVKRIYAEENHLSPEELFTVYVTSCTAEKDLNECDATITTTELVEIIRRACVSRFTMNEIWNQLEEEGLDSIIKGSTTNADFNEFGGMMELVVASTQNEQKITVKAITVDNIPEALKLIDSDYDCIEVMACTGGCYHGGGQFRKDNA